LKARLNPKLEEKISGSSNILSQISSYINKQIELIVKKAVIGDGERLRINLKRISKLDKNFLNLLLKSILENNFKIELNSENIFSLADLIKSETGRLVQLKEKIVALKERNELVVQKKKKERKRNSSVQLKIGQKIEIDGKLISIEEVNKKMIKFTQDKSIEYISNIGLNKTFEIRKWKDGDRFQPIGLRGTKKISDFLADEKITSSEKKNQLVLINNGKIVWAVGHRIDEKFKINFGSKKTLKLFVTEK
jgi:tRNA(Ile)-lysidine synthase